MRKGSMFNIKSWFCMKLSLVKSYDQMFHYFFSPLSTLESSLKLREHPLVRIWGSLVFQVHVFSTFLIAL